MRIQSRTHERGTGKAEHRENGRKVTPIRELETGQAELLPYQALERKSDDSEGITRKFITLKIYRGGFLGQASSPPDPKARLPLKADYLGLTNAPTSLAVRGTNAGPGQTAPGAIPRLYSLPMVLSPAPISGEFS